MRLISIIKRLKWQLSKTPIFIKCNELRCTNNKDGYCDKQYYNEIEINTERKCITFDFD